MFRMTEVVKQLIIINIIFFVGKIIIGQSIIYEYLAFHYFGNPSFKPWQIVSYMFIHADIRHIFFNMLLLFFFGPSLEDQWGGSKFLFFYLSCGVGAILATQGISYFAFHDSLNILATEGYNKADVLAVLNEGKSMVKWEEILTLREFNNLMSYRVIGIGASGAIYGVLAAFAFLFPNREVYLMFVLPVKIKYLIAFYIIGDLISGFKGQMIIGAAGGVGYFGHVGGALIGFLMMLYWKNHQFKNNRWN
ncbi:rhomboid family intramembrane serine protease [Flavobacterium rakeshii]|uniref:Rhomboid family intramembrane serine protease n=2 Tax=Flavobacterium rakeshii TaxID=1038845 RepID=A0A6N8H6T0_9FLAO|nr:rhomboid family intramembrane serine protease [Flavobacterium rakeshii]